MQRNYLLSFGASPFDMLSSDFMVFFILALESIGLVVFMESWLVGPVVWAAAAETLPIRAAQHAAINRFRILISFWNKRPREME